MSEPNTPAHPEIDPQTQRHIDRFKQGSVVWNKWANDMLARKSELEKAGKWSWNQKYQYFWDIIISDNFEISSEEMRVWIKEASVDFSNLNSKEFISNDKFKTQDIINCRDYIFPGPVNFRSTVFDHPASFEGARFLEEVDFHGATFKNNVVFINVYCYGIAAFTKAVFNGKGIFNKSKFYNHTVFQEVVGEKLLDFTNTHFMSEADFNSMKFQAEGNFYKAKFYNVANFRLVRFYESVMLDKVEFRGVVDFSGMISKGLFSMGSAIYTNTIPNFTQANFVEIPRLDNIKILPSPSYKKIELPSKKLLGAYNWQKYFWNKKLISYWNGIISRCVYKFTQTTLPTIIYFSESIKHIWSKFTNFRRNPDEEAHYRALKRLAIQAHDHENEMKFFAGEVRARRHLTDYANFLTHDFAGSMRYWAGVLYELFSDFGRSFIRPIIWWSACLWLFANLTLSGAGLVNDKKCHNSTITPNQAAYTIGLKNSLLILGLNKTNIVKQAEQCLYGINKNKNATNKLSKHNPKIKRTYQAKTTKTDIPFKAMVQGILHSGLSILFIFLFLLAIRNQFKIK